MTPNTIAKPVKNLLFDLGGVIMDIDRNRCVRAYEALGMKDANEFLGEYKQAGVFAAIEGGQIDIDGFHREMHKLLPAGVTDLQIDEAFGQFLLGIPVERLQALRQLREEGYGIYLLSNTNPVMWNREIRWFFQVEGREREDYFDGIVTSFEAKCMKPDAGIFHYAAEHLGINPAETLFFDDSQANVEAARACGYQAELVIPTRGCDLFSIFCGRFSLKYLRDPKFTRNLANP
ncbi:MAG: HAD family phosphatase [Bacteroidales bacterium]|nr:HAD family phosphatase [Bacteroidales bacterium]MCD8395047.1 HAD family phosphatase [Bacteroidales bacterium]